ncbi:unnamed protein product [Rotaria sp. Silwood2]|nr:unnamed protein product [Rotaria sp. Silwood2]
MFAVKISKSILAFPRIGDEPFDFDYKLIAEYMIDETYQKLKTSVHYPLIVSFVLLPEQHDTYGAFADPLETIRIIEDKPTRVKIKLTSFNNNQLIEYENKIKQLAQSYSFKLHLTDKTDLADWSQENIQKYYDYCLQRRVISTIDI